MTLDYLMIRNAMNNENCDQHYLLKWTKYTDNLSQCFENYYDNESLVDVTLFTDGKVIKAHKIILSACSPYFETLFTHTVDKHPVVVLKDVTFPHLSLLLDFMYRGEVNVPQVELSAFLETAKNLCVKGLTENIDLSRDSITAQMIRSTARRSSEISPQYRSNVEMMHSSPSVEHKNLRRMPDLYSPPSSMPSVLSKALTMPSPLHLGSPLGMPHLSSLPASLASSLVNAHSMSGNFTHPNHMVPRRPDICESPYAKRRRKYRKQSGEVVVESGDSDGRSSGSPGDTNLHLPKIPATITPISKHPIPPPSNHSNGIHSMLPYDLQPKDLSINSQTANSIENLSQKSPRHPPVSKTSPITIPQLLPTTTIDRKLIHDPETSENELPNRTNNSVKSEFSHESSDSGSSPSTDKNDQSRRSDEIGDRTSLKGSSDPESTKLHDTNSDLDMRSEDETEETKKNNPGTSSSRLQNEEEVASAPAYLASWPYVKPENSPGEEIMGSLNENSTAGDYLRAYNIVRAGMEGLLQQRSHLPPDLLGVRPPALGALPPIMMAKDPVQVNASPREPRQSRNYSYSTAKNFHCVKCGRSYASTGNLKRHLKYECGVDPQFSCPMCGKRFQHRHSVKIHIVSTHLKELQDTELFKKYPSLTESQMEILKSARAEIMQPRACSKDSRENSVDEFYMPKVNATSHDG